MNTVVNAGGEHGQTWHTKPDMWHRLEHWCAKRPGHAGKCRCACGMPQPSERESDG